MPDPTDLQIDPTLTSPETTALTNGLDLVSQQLPLSAAIDGLVRVAYLHEADRHDQQVRADILRRAKEVQGILRWMASLTDEILDTSGPTVPALAEGEQAEVAHAQ